MFHVVLYQPEIPPNTGNIMRLCANTGAHLHLVEPIGFRMDEKSLTRAGMDYRDISVVTRHTDWTSCRAALAGRRMFALTTRGERGYHEPTFQPGDVFLFGAEGSGLPERVHAEFEPTQRLRIPMQAESRSLNLANAVSIVVYEAWRQCGFTGAV